MIDAEATRILKSREIEIHENNVGEDADQLLLREADALRHALTRIVALEDQVRGLNENVAQFSVEVEDKEKRIASLKATMAERETAIANLHADAAVRIRENVRLTVELSIADGQLARVRDTRATLPTFTLFADFIIALDAALAKLEDKR